MGKVTSPAKRSEKIPLIAKNDIQKEALRSIHENVITILHGQPGTGKTFLPVIYGLKEFIEHRRYRRLIFTRPCIEAFGENLGFLPGSFNDKISPYLLPIMQTLEEYLDPAYIKRLVADGSIMTLPFAFLRGVTFKDAFVVADECQNTIPEQIRLLLTRIGDGTKVVMTGDLNQCDRDRKNHNGLQDAVKRLSGVQGVGIVHLDRTCIVRAPIVEKIEEKYEA